MHLRHLWLNCGLLFVAVWGWTANLSAADRLAPAQAAQEADRLLAEDLNLEQLPGATPANPADDETFLRRVTFDLVGRPPTTAEITEFALDPAVDKRAVAVRRLLADEQFGQNWSRYWRDVIMYRTSDPRGQIASGALQTYIAEKFNANASWQDIAKDFITATGDVRENGATAIIMAQQGMAEETTAEISRIFMGIQIQCAQCHDHPTDRWKREQFHELAAFFPRIAVRPRQADGQRSFEVVSVNGGRPGRPGGGGNRGSGRGEHYMSDLENPSARGTLMTPKFFVNGWKSELGKTDEERRDLVANWITSSSNEWFAKAFVNRVWAELVGEGFYEPIDDMGPDRQCSAPKTMDYLAQQFIEQRYDIKWLYETVASTEAYHRESLPRREVTDAPFAGNCNQPLRGDQLFSSINAALGLNEQSQQQNRQRGPYGQGGPRAAFNQTFGFDPSNPREEITGSIPQALYMMNSPQINGPIRGNGRNTSLGRLLAEEQSDEAVAAELYLRCLSRQPKESELQICLDHVKESNDRAAAFEDVLWALVNSAEFMHRK